MRDYNGDLMEEGEDARLRSMRYVASQISDATRVNARAASTRAGIHRGILRRPSPLTGEVDYSTNETDFLAAVDSYKRQSGRNFPTACELLAVAESIGYARVGGAGGLAMVA